jgi:hypothetical protein
MNWFNLFLLYSIIKALKSYTTYNVATTEVKIQPKQLQIFAEPSYESNSTLRITADLTENSIDQIVPGHYGIDRNYVDGIGNILVTYGNALNYI